ncbi:universal stress protein [Nocardia carnea]|uniref:Universal stress protein n=1 Tax=Nocardia carnea TaxID=37328 RepID=A0ABW7TPZ2_9NOCA|nr:universal stress protein [Nocardia carnea]
MTERTAPAFGNHSAADVVAAVDGSPSSYRAVAWAAVEASMHGCGLHLINSWAIPSGFGPEATMTENDLRWLYDQGQRVVDEAEHVARTASPGKAPIISTEVTSLLITTALIKRSHSARMVVVGSRGLGAFQRGLLGSVSTAVARHAWCPVAVIHADAPLDSVSAGRPVVVGVDGSDNSAPAVALAFDEAARRNVGLIAMHSWSDTSGLDFPIRDWDDVRNSADRALAETLAGYREQYPDVAVQRIVRVDRPARSLHDASADAQLVVVGSRGRGGFRGLLLGSTSDALLHSVDTPLIVVRARPAHNDSAGEHE